MTGLRYMFRLAQYFCAHILYIYIFYPNFIPLLVGHAFRWKARC